MNEKLETSEFDSACLNVKVAKLTHARTPNEVSSALQLAKQQNFEVVFCNLECDDTTCEQILDLVSPLCTVYKQRKVST